MATLIELPGGIPSNLVKLTDFSHTEAGLIKHYVCRNLAAHERAAWRTTGNRNGCPKCGRRGRLSAITDEDGNMLAVDRSLLSDRLTTVCSVSLAEKMDPLEALEEVFRLWLARAVVLEGATLRKAQRAAKRLDVPVGLLVETAVQEHLTRRPARASGRRGMSYGL